MMTPLRRLTAHPDGTRLRPRGRLALAAGLAAVALASAACGGTSSSTTTTKPSSSSSSSSSTTTTLTSSERSLLAPRLLTLSQFPTGWTHDTNPAATSTKGTPSCLADVADAKGSATRLSTVFLSPEKELISVIQTVAHFKPGRAKPSAAVIQKSFGTCQGGSIKANGVMLKVNITYLPNVPTGGVGFAAQMSLSSGGKSVYVNVFYAVKGDFATFLGLDTESSSTSQFASIAVKALAAL